MATNQAPPLLTQLSSISTKINTNLDPHNPYIYLDRARIYVHLGFHDLAAADAYRALMLLECVWEAESAEYVARRRRQEAAKDQRDGQEEENDQEGEDEDDEEDEEDEEDDEFVEITRTEYDTLIGETYLILVSSLARCGCLRDAHEFQSRAIEHLLELIDQTNNTDDTNDEKEANNEFNKTIAQLKHLETSLFPSEKKLPVQGYARRVLYPWNEHEPDRKSAETLSLLNQRLEDVAPDLEVRAVALPALHSPSSSSSSHNNNSGEDAGEVSIQLGLFAKKDLPSGTTILRESSLLTATNRLHDDLCDACNSPLPDLSAGIAVACPECPDTIFCTQACHDRAQTSYHAAICGHEGLDAIGKDVADPQDKADYLYFLLLARAVAMAETQGVHPLELPEIKYIWGDFHPYHNHNHHPNHHHSNQQNNDEDKNKKDKDEGKLPFSFQLSILLPFRLLEEMGLDPFTNLDKYDTWVLNTLYAKFRGTASGRLSTWDGGPEVCAVHPLWCLANHSCDPNVRWEWGGEVCFVVREQGEKAVWKRTDKKDGIRADEEILNHYCDVGLDVGQRREWARGALGGLCQCERCRWEINQ